jgi:hypothetical protein
MPGPVYLLALFVLTAVPVWSQTESSGAKPAAEEGTIWSRVEPSGDAAEGENAMIALLPVGDEGYSLTFSSEMPRSNYLRGGLNFGSAYDDNVLSSSGPGVRGFRYSVWPSISLEQTRSRVRWNLDYSPSFTSYHSKGSTNQTDHNVALGLEYRLSPHVALSVRDSFQKTSDFLNLAEQDTSFLAAGAPQFPINSIVPPATTRINNFGDAELTYQFDQNAMVGVKGTFSGLWYPQRANLRDLFDATAKTGEGFYTHRLSGRHYIGATYRFQQLFTQTVQVQTQTHSMLLFYTLYLPSTITVTLFAGPERSETHGGTSLPLNQWSPALGGSLAWHGARVGFAAGYSRRIRDGGGLSGAVHSDSADASVRWRLARTFTAALGGNYVSNRVLDALPSFTAGGHSFSANVSLQHPLGENLGVQVGYTRLHQRYSNLEAISSAPDRNTAWVSLSYQFDRPFGR